MAGTPQDNFYHTASTTRSNFNFSKKTYTIIHPNPYQDPPNLFHTSQFHKSQFQFLQENHTLWSIPIQPKTNPTAYSKIHIIILGCLIYTILQTIFHFYHWSPLTWFFPSQTSLPPYFSLLPPFFCLSLRYSHTQGQCFCLPYSKPHRSILWVNV